MAGQRRRRLTRLLRAWCMAALAWSLVSAALDSAAAFAPGVFRGPLFGHGVLLTGMQQSSRIPSKSVRHVFDPVGQDLALQAEVSNLAGLFDTSLLTSFSDQAGNINGILFQGSLLPYLLFIYFLGYRGNNTPPLVQFGFIFLLAFVISTIPSGIISKSTYGLILADSDWIHGTAESLLTCTNIMIVLGFRSALLGEKESPDNSFVSNTAYGWLAAVVFFLASGVGIWGFQAHTPFLAGLGNLDANAFAMEPVNALSIPNWMVHWSTVFEFLLAMSLAWRYADASGNPRWKGLTWGMLPSSISSVCALTFHVFYNQIPWILTAQAFFTFFGNTTLGIAAFRIAVSNGWTVSELDPRPALGRGWEKLTSGKDESSDSDKDEKQTFDSNRVVTVSSEELTPAPLLALEGALLTVLFAYGTKYGELTFGSSIWQSPDSSAAAVAVILIPVSIVFYSIYSRSPDIQSGQLPPLAFAGALTSPVAVSTTAATGKAPDAAAKEDKPGGSSFEDVKSSTAVTDKAADAAAKEDKPGGISFEDVKKYGVAGTVAYVLTELVFWAVAAPVASYSLYTTTGHWPDLLTSNEDRAAVAAFIFAGANIARAFVPVRLGAALALAPWVDDNIVSKFGGGGLEGSSDAGQKNP